MKLEDVPFQLVDGQKILTEKQVIDNPELMEFLKGYNGVVTRDVSRACYYFEEHPPQKFTTPVDWNTSHVEVSRGRPVPPHASGGGEIRTQRQAPFEHPGKKP